MSSKNNLFSHIFGECSDDLAKIVVKACPTTQAHPLDLMEVVPIIKK